MSQHPDTLSPGYFSDEIIEIEIETERKINSGPRRKPQVRWKDRYPEWTIDRILELADAHFTRHNKYPTQKSGPILEAPGETWLGVSHSLSRGQRGLDKHVSLAHFLAEHRGVKRHIHGVKLSCDLILNLADQYHERTGHWPTATKELAEGAEGRSWLQIDLALRSGNGVTDAAEPSSLAKLLCAHRGRPHKHAQPEYKLDEILCWAFNHYERTGDWPGKHSGPIVEAPGETWKKVASAFVKGHRGLRGCGYTTLIGFLTEQANRPSQRGRKPGTNLQLPTRPKRTYTNWTVERILELADSYYSSFGKWPIVRSGRINEEIDGTWASIDSALKRGHRGLPGGSSLYALIKDRRGVDTRIGKAHLTAECILLWADNHYARTGLWPNMYSGTIAEAPDESWKQIDQALRHGRRGLPGGGTLASFLRAERPQFSRRLRPLLDIEAVLGYADAFFAREGRWPKITSGPIAEATDQTWCEVNYDIADKYHRIQRTIRHMPGRFPTFSQDGAYFAIDWHGTVRVFDAKTWKPVKALLYDHWETVGLAFGNGGRTIIRASSNRGTPSVLDITDFNTGTNLRHWTESAYIASMTVSRDGTLLALAVGNTIKIYRLDDIPGH